MELPPIKSKNLEKAVESDAPLNEKSTFQNKDLTEFDCVMNKQKLLKPEISYTVYPCSTCPGKLEYICESCIENCHKGHNLNAKKVIGKQVFLNEVSCQCAMNGHMVMKKLKVTTNKQVKDVNVDTTELCELNSVLHQSNSKYYYVDKEDNCIYCIFCMKICRNKISDEEEVNQSTLSEKFIMQEVSNFTISPKCHCTNKECHGSFADNVGCLQFLFIGEVFDKFFNKSLVPFQIIKNAEIRNRIFSPLLDEFKKLSDKMYSGDYAYYQHNNLSEDSLSGLSLLIAIGDAFEHEKQLILEPSIESLYSFDFLKLLFESDARRKDCLFGLKIYALQLFRKLHILPSLRPNNIKIIENFTMTCPLHRILLSKDISEFYKDIQIEESKFLDFMELVSNSVIDYAFLYIEDSLYSNLILEYLEIVCLLVSYRIDHEIALGFVAKINKILTPVQSK